MGVKSSTLCQIAAHAGYNLLRVLFAAPIVLMACWMFYVGTERWSRDDFWRKFPPDYGCNDHVLLDRCSLQQLLYMWLGPAVLALAAIGLLALRAILPHESHRSSRGNKIGSYLLPPRGFWLWWCGGLTVCDFLAVCVWAAINVVWMNVILKRFWTLIPIFTKAAGSPSLVLQIELVSVALGCLLFPNLVLLFYPVTRGSVVLQATGISYPDAIRYHRWLGHAVMIIVTAHSLGFWGVWLWQQQWLQEALGQGDRVNNLAGGVSFISGLALWLSSLEVARRSNYEVFYKLHHIGFWGFTFAGCCHVWNMFWYFLPGLVLYGIDGVYRMHQAVANGSSVTNTSSSVTDKQTNKMAAVQVVEAAASRNGGICSLLITTPRYELSATGFIWLNVPQISWHSWHPFEYFAVPVNNISDNMHPGSSSSGMLVHIKAYDRWTRELIKLIQQQQQSGSSSSSSSGVKFTVKVEGPYAELPSAVLGHPEVAAAAAKTAGSSSKGHHTEMVDGLVVIAGGVGVTAAMSVFQELSVTGAATAGLPALMIWACRYVDELEFLAPRVLAMANALQLNMTIQLYYTGDPKKLLAAAAASPVGPAAASSTPPLSAAAAAMSGSSSSGVTHHLTSSSMCPVVALRSFWCQVGHKTLLHLVAFGGVLGAVLLVRYYSTVLPTMHEQKPWTTGQMGAAHVIMTAAAIIIPGMLLLWCTLAAARPGSSSSSGSKKGMQQDEKNAELSMHLLAGTNGAAAHDATAAADNRVAAAAAAAVAAKEPALLLPLETAASAAVSGRDKVSWQLHIPTVAAAAAIPVELGRPNISQSVNTWLTTQRLLPAAAAAADAKRQYDVYGMGPTKLVGDAQLLCDVINKRGEVQMNFVQKTHEL